MTGNEHKGAEKRAPVQGFSGGIPWSMHLRAYDAYCARHSPQPALIDLEGRNCRGGFSVGELDMFIPGWRDELSEITALRRELAAKDAELSALRETAIDVTANLAAAVSLLEHGGKKGAPSHRMFAVMLADYRASLDRARAALTHQEKDAQDVA